MQGSRQSLAASLLLALALVGSGMVGPAVAQTHAAEPRGADAFAQQSEPETATETNDSATNDSTVRHVNPDGAEDEETLEELRGVLTDRLADRLSESTVRISEGQHDRARNLLGEEYLDALEKYAEVESELDDEETASDFERARSSQENFSQSAQEFDETVEAYREAKRRGDESEARRLARRLNDVSTEAERSADRLDTAYANLSRETGEDFSEERDRIATVEANISAVRDEIVTAELRTTTLTVAADDSHASFVEPMRIDGRLTLPNESPVADRVIEIDVGERRYEARTDENGRFELDYRPTTLSVNASNVTVRYVPRESSVYTASNGTLPIDVEQVNATASIDERTTRVAYGEPVFARGTVSVDGRSVPGYPLSLTLDNRSLAADQTADDGSFSTNGTLPASVPDGERSVRVEGARSDAAVAVSAQSEDVVVESTPTNLTISVRTNESSIVATGRLTTADGRAIEGRSVDVAVGGETIETAETRSDGRYELQFESDELDGSTASAAFDGSGSNLESSTASARLPAAQTSAEGGENSSGGVGLGGDPAVNDGVDDADGFVESVLGWLFTSSSGIGSGSSASAAFAVVVLVLALGWYALRRVRSATDRTSSKDSTRGEGEKRDTSRLRPPEAMSVAGKLFERGEFEQAVRMAYWSVQSAVSPILDESSRRYTHREFYRMCKNSERISDDELDTLVETYELTVYGNQTNDTKRVREAVDAAKRLVREFRRGPE